jgi:O-antigen/teichoic acid export membrane protein
MTLGRVVNTVVVAARARAFVDRGRPTRTDRTILLRLALPLGLASVLASVYFTIDLILLGWLVHGPQLGNYAAATKILSLLVMVPGLVMSSALPGFSSVVRAGEGMNELGAKVLGWLLATWLPLCVASAIFARPIVHVALGSQYDGAVPLVRILALAGAVALIANVLGTLLIAASIVRPMVLQNVVATVFNIGGNVLLVPRYGVVASAWLTVATELIVSVGALALLWRRLAPRPWLAAGFRPALAAAGLAGTGLALAGRPVLGIPISGAVFLVIIVLLRGWPAELHPVFRR